MEQRWTLYLMLAVVTGVPTQALSIPRSTSVSDAAEAEQLDSLQKGSVAYGESTGEKSYGRQSKGKITVDSRSNVLLAEQPSISTSVPPKRVSHSSRRSFRDGSTSEDGFLKKAVAPVTPSALDLLETLSDFIEFSRLTQNDLKNQLKLYDPSKSRTQSSDMKVERDGELPTPTLQKIGSSSGRYSSYVPVEHVDHDGETFSKTRHVEIPEETNRRSVESVESNNKRSAGAHIPQSNPSLDEGAAWPPFSEKFQGAEIRREQKDSDLPLTLSPFESGDQNVLPLVTTFGAFLRKPERATAEPPEAQYGCQHCKQIQSGFRYTNEKMRDENRVSSRKETEYNNKEKILKRLYSGNASIFRKVGPKALTGDSLQEKVLYDVIPREVLKKFLQEKGNSIPNLKREILNRSNAVAEIVASQQPKDSELQTDKILSFDPRKCSQENCLLHEQREPMGVFESLLQLEKISAKKLTGKLRDAVLKIDLHGDINTEQTAQRLKLEQKIHSEIQKKNSIGKLRKLIRDKFPEMRPHTLEQSVFEDTSPEYEHQTEVVNSVRYPELDMMAAYIGDAKNKRKPSDVRENFENVKAESKTRMQNLKGSKDLEGTKNGWDREFISTDYNKNSYPFYAFLKQFNKLCKVKDRFYGFKDGKNREMDKWKYGEKTAPVDPGCDEGSFIEQLILSSFNETCDNPRGNMIAKFVNAKVYSALQERLIELKPKAQLVIKLTLHVSDHSNLDQLTRFEKLTFYKAFLKAALEFEELHLVSTHDLPAETCIEMLVQTSGMQSVEADLLNIGYDIKQRVNRTEQISEIMSAMVVMVNEIMLAASENPRLRPLLIEEPAKSRKFIQTMLLEELFAQSVSNEFVAQIAPQERHEYSWPLNGIPIENSLEFNEFKTISESQIGTLFPWFSETSKLKVREKSPTSINEVMSEEESSQISDEKEKLEGKAFGQNIQLTTKKFNENFTSSKRQGMPQLASDLDATEEDKFLSSTGQSFDNFSEREFVLAEKCHNRDLMLCGKPALEKLQKEKDMKQRCRVREEFLTCMSRQRNKGCVADDVAVLPDTSYDSPDISRLRSELRRNFHNCVLSYTIPDQSLGL